MVTSEPEEKPSPRITKSGRISAQHQETLHSPTPKLN